MYEAYWELSEPPFDNSPNPKFFYLSPEHEEALGRLLYKVPAPQGCGMLTGEYGCGKTTLSRALIQRLEAERYEIGLLTNPSWNAVDFLREALYQLGAESRDKTKSELLHQLNDVFFRNFREGRDTVLIVDEAQLIEDDAVFEELRLLMNFQTDDRFLVTLLLIGSPELRERVRRLKHLVQRVEVVPDGDALVEVLEPAHALAQLWRADEEQRDQEAIVRLEVHQQTDFLEDGVVRDELRLVHDDDRVAAVAVVAEEQVVEQVEQLGLARLLRLDAQLVERLAQEVGGVPARVGQQADLVALGLQPLDQRARERGLAAAVLAGEHPAALPVAHGVHEADECLLVLRRQIEELRVRGVVEGRLAQLPVGFVHGLLVPVREWAVEQDEDPRVGGDQARDERGDGDVVLPPLHRDLGHRHHRARLERRCLRHRVGAAVAEGHRGGLDLRARARAAGRREILARREVGPEVLRARGLHLAHDVDLVLEHRQHHDVAVLDRDVLRLVFLDEEPVQVDRDALRGPGVRAVHEGQSQIREGGDAAGLHHDVTHLLAAGQLEALDDRRLALRLRLAALDGAVEGAAHLDHVLDAREGRHVERVAGPQRNVGGGAHGAQVERRRFLASVGADTREARVGARAGDGDAARQLEQLAQRAAGPELVLAGAAHGAGEGDGGHARRHVDAHALLDERVLRDVALELEEQEVDLRRAAVARDQH